LSFDDKELIWLDDDNPYPAMRHKFASSLSSCDELVVQSIYLPKECKHVFPWACFPFSFQYLFLWFDSRQQVKLGVLFELLHLELYLL